MYAKTKIKGWERTSGLPIMGTYSHCAGNCVSHLLLVSRLIAIISSKKWRLPTKEASAEIGQSVNLGGLTAVQSTHQLSQNRNQNLLGGGLCALYLQFITYFGFLFKI